MPDVQGRCPACGGASLFLGEGGHVTCWRTACVAPSAADQLLQGDEAALAALLGGGPAGRGIAGMLTMRGFTFPKLWQATDDELTAVPGIGEESLARIRTAIPSPTPEEQASPVDWQAIAEQRERELRTVGETRHAAERRANQVEDLLRVAHKTSNRSEAERARAVERAEQAETTVARVRAEVARIRSITPTWGPVADLIEAAIDDPERPREQRMRPTHADGTPYSYFEITAEGWGFCDGCHVWSTASPECPHACPETCIQGPVAEESPDA